MTRWQDVQDLFDGAVALPAAERARFVRERAGGDAALRSEVESLLAADDAALPELDQSASELLRELRLERPADELCGTSFDCYRIDAHVASGGMAHVYRATRTTAGVERRVAIKVLRHGLDRDALLRRFDAERATLASLEHEHIVTFLDAGTLPDGRPFLVMEYVDGVPCTQWARGTPLRERLRVFLEVLLAVQYAHGRLIVHRDLKPSNVLVTTRGAPKLLDFGVATVLGADAAGPSPLTPVYASPEQLAGAPVTAASDVFALGVLLRDVLAAPGARAGADLQHVVAKATAADPAARYGSAADFAHDLRRWLAHEPVTARRPSWAYRVHLFGRRHRWPVALAAAVTVSLVAGWISADLDRRSAARDAGLGWGAHAEAKAAARIFERWIAAAAAADEALAMAAIDHLERAVRDELVELPEAETVVRMALAQLWLDRGDRTRAAGHAERAVALARTTRGIGRSERERAAALLARARSGG